MEQRKRAAIAPLLVLQLVLFGSKGNEYLVVGCQSSIAAVKNRLVDRRVRAPRACRPIRSVYISCMLLFTMYSPLLL